MIFDETISHDVSTMNVCHDVEAIVLEGDVFLERLDDGHDYGDDDDDDHHHPRLHP